MSCTRRKTRVSWSLICPCFCDVPVVSSCCWETTTFDEKVQFSNFEKRRGDDVMSTSFWFQGVPCVACFVVCPHVVFQFQCRMSRCTSVGAHSTATVCAMCVCSVFWRCPHVGVFAVGVPGCSTWLHIALRECFPCQWFVVFPTSRAVTCSGLFFKCSTVAAR